MIEIAFRGYHYAFDVLLALVRRGEYPIEEVPLPEITRQFLAHVQSTQFVDVDEGGSFVEVASWLTLLKSRAALPADDQQETPQQEFARVLLSSQALQTTARMLGDRLEDTGALRGFPSAGACTASPAVSAADTLQELLELAETLLAKATLRQAAEATVAPDTCSASAIRHYLDKQLAVLALGQPVHVNPWLEEQANPQCRASLLLVLLELARTGTVLLHQPSPQHAVLLKLSGNEIS